MSAISACRSCGGSKLAIVLSLGEVPLANALVSEADRGKPEPRYPLELVLCETCALLQITETVPPEILFRDYRYFSSFSDTMLRHAAAVTAKMVAAQNLGSSSLAAEIASNDGYLLKNYVKRGIPVLGIEPARNVAKVALEQGVRTVTEFFGTELAEKLVAGGMRADVLHANNVMAHVPDICGVFSGVRTFLADGGAFVMESPYVKPMLDHGEFDTIYHEHLFYWSLTALDHVAKRSGLVITDVEHLQIHGGSVRVFMKRSGEPSRAVKELLAEEATWGVTRVGAYEDFANRVGRLKNELVALLHDLKAKGHTIAAYGAAAKGSTLLTTFGIGKDLLGFVADRSTHKQGRYMPGIDVPIVAAEELSKRRPDYCLLLTWNFADEILAQQKAYRDAGGKFVVPVPEVKVV